MRHYGDTLKIEEESSPSQPQDRAVAFFFFFVDLNCCVHGLGVSRVIRFFHACTAILRLVHDFSALVAFSPFAEEGFMCLDHSAMSKKKKQTCT